MRPRIMIPGTAFALVLALASTGVAAQQSRTGTQAEPLFTVLNPTGTPPPIERKSLAARPASLDGRTIYFVDITFNNGDVLLQKMQAWFAANMPKVKTVFKVKAGGVGTDDPELWAEMKAANAMMIMAIGH